MLCTTCGDNFHPQPSALKVFATANYGVEISVQECPACNEVLVLRRQGTALRSATGVVMVGAPTPFVVVYPLKKQAQTVPVEVPEPYRADFLEARAILATSSKAAAAMARRLLQHVFHDVLKIKKRDLNQEIDEFIATSGAPLYLTQAVDAVRQIGNFAAHPLKFSATGSIVPVDDGEAEWTLEVVFALLDYVFVQPARLEKRRAALNAKLKEIGKPPLK